MKISYRRYHNEKQLKKLLSPAEIRFRRLMNIINPVHLIIDKLYKLMNRGVFLRNYIATTFLSILILGKLMGILNILLGRYTSTFVSYFTIAPIDSYQINDLAKEKQTTFKLLAVLSGIIDIFISLLLILILSKVETEVILLLGVLLYANTTLFSKYMEKYLQLNY